jgi:hypothetical protein
VSHQGDWHKGCRIVCMARDCCEIQARRRRRQMTYKMIMMRYVAVKVCGETDTHRRKLARARGGGGQMHLQYFFYLRIFRVTELKGGK